jgi:hypothetical protein
MSRTIFSGMIFKASMLLSIAIGHAAVAADDPCTHFTWDVTHELAVMKQSPQTIAVGVKPGAEVPQLATEKLYDIQLAPQNTVVFAVKPAKPALDDGAQAGLLRFKTSKAQRYRVSITSGHWIDVIDGQQTLRSRDFQGQRGCERPRKIVEYDLPPERELILQFSGSTDAKVLLAITAVDANH